MQAKVEQQQATISEQELKVEALISEQRHYDAAIETQREKQHESQEEFQTIQDKFYQIGAEIARLEEAIAHQKQRQEQLLQDKAEAQAELQAALDLQQTDSQNINSLKQKVAELEPQVSTLSEQQSLAQAQLEESESSYHQWQERWDDFNSTAAESSQQAHLAQAKVTHLEERLSNGNSQIERLQQQLQTASAITNCRSLLPSCKCSKSNWVHNSPKAKSNWQPHKKT